MSLTLNNLANTVGALGDLAEKKRLLEQALAIKIAHYGTEEHIDVAATLTNLANAVGTLGDRVEEKKLIERALAIKKKHITSPLQRINSMSSYVFTMKTEKCTIQI